MNSSGIEQISVVFAIIAMLLINVLTFYLHDSLSAAYNDKLKSSINEKEKEYYYNQCELMKQSVDETKSFKHDINNHLAIVKELLLVHLNVAIFDGLFAAMLR